MDKLCRLCLKSCTEMRCKLGENILSKLSRLNIQVILFPFLPSQICTECVRTLKDFLKFRETVSKNEQKLLHYLRDGKLDELYQNILNDNRKENIGTENVDDRYGNDDFKATDDTGLDTFNLENSNDNVSNKIEIIIEGTSIANTTANVKIKKPQRRSKTKKRQTSSKYLKKSSNGDSTKSNIDENDINDWSTPKKENYFELKKENETESNESGNSIIKTNIIDDHKCLTCFKYLLSHSDLIKHYNTEHGIEENKKLDTPKTITKDQKIDISLNNDSKEMVRLEDIRRSDRPYNCKICGRTFASVYTIIRHGRAHKAPSIHCSFGCGYSTVYRGALRDHEKRHENNYKYKCATCGAGFQVKTWHDQHQNVHNNVKPFVCDICGVAFHMDRYLTSHRTTVHPDSAKGVYRYSCTHCELAFNSIQNFKVHLEQHKGKRSYLCDLCGKECRNNEQLKRHSETHMGLKPFACSVCNKKFARKFNVKIHEKAHAGQKFLCRHCGKYFAQRSTLLRHCRQRHPSLSGNIDTSSTFNGIGKSKS